MMITNTVRYFPDARYTDLATNTTLGTATRFDSTSKTLTIAETGSRTFKSVRLRAYFQDRFTVATTITGVRMGVKLGAAATVDVDRSFTLADTGDHERSVWEYDATAYFVANFGGAATQTFIASLAVSTNNASNIGGTIWFELIITYEYDNTSGTTRTSSIPVLIQSHHVALTSGSMVEVGTTVGAVNAPANQIPAFDTYLEEAGKTYKDMAICWMAATGATASDTTPSIEIDSTGAVGMGLIGQALNTERLVTGVYNYPFGTHSTASAHAFKAQTNVASTLNGFGAIMWVTYTYDTTTTTRVTNYGMPAVVEVGDVDGRVMRTLSPTDDVSADATVLECVLDIQEPGTITLKQGGVLFSVMGLSGGTMRYACGGQAYRSYLAGTGVTSLIVHRADHSTGWTLARGENRLSVKYYQSLITRIQSNGIGFVVYSSDVPAAGPDVGNRALDYLQGIAGTTPALLTLQATAAQNPVDLDAPWSISALVQHGTVRSVSSTGFPGVLMSEVKASELVQGAGWITHNPIGQGALAELQTSDVYWPFTMRYRQTSSEGATRGRLDPTTTRKHYIQGLTNTSHSGLSTIVTVHFIKFVAAGTVRVGGAPVANGKTVQVWTEDANGKGELLGSAVTAGGAGGFSLDVHHNTRAAYFATYNNDGFVGRSQLATPA